MQEIRSLVCGHVFRDERPIKVVIHHSDGEWQLVCGEHDHPEDCSDFKVVGIGHLIERQSNLNNIGDLKPGWMAEWTPGGWNFVAHDD